jgi:cytochrome c biogenesis protein ResB
VIRNILKKTWRFLARLNVAAVLIIILLLLTALGSCFPQASPAFTADAERLANWEMGIRDRYGGLTDTLVTLGVFRWFRSPVFIISLTLLAVLTLVCTLDRWRGVWQRAFHRPVSCPDGVFESGPHAARLKIPLTAAQPDTLRESLRQRGFHVQAETIGDFLYLRGDRNRLAPLATLVTHLAVLLLLSSTILSHAYGWQETLTIGPDETASIEHDTGLTLRNDGLTIARYPDGSVAGYEAKVTVLEADQNVFHCTVQVNEPLIYNGIGFYLQGYGGTAGVYSIILLAVRDPGYGLVIVAGFLLLLGITISFNFPHCWLHARLEPDGTLRLAAWAGRRACDFEREFKTLTAELEYLVGSREENPD